MLLLLNLLPLILYVCSVVWKHRLELLSFHSFRLAALLGFFYYDLPLRHCLLIQAALSYFRNDHFKRPTLNKELKAEKCMLNEGIGFCGSFKRQVNKASSLTCSRRTNYFFVAKKLHIIYTLFVSERETYVMSLVDFFLWFQILSKMCSDFTL